MVTELVKFSTRIFEAMLMISRVSNASTLVTKALSTPYAEMNCATSLTQSAACQSLAQQSSESANWGGSPPGSCLRRRAAGLASMIRNRRLAGVNSTLGYNRPAEFEFALPTSIMMSPV